MHVPSVLGKHDSSGARFQAIFVLEFEAKWQDHFLKLNRKHKQFFYAPWFLHLTAVWIILVAYEQLSITSSREAFMAWCGGDNSKINNL